MKRSIFFLSPFLCSTLAVQGGCQKEVIGFPHPYFFGTKF